MDDPRVEQPRGFVNPAGRSRWTLLGLAGLLLLGTAAAIPLDAPAAQWFAAEHLPAAVRKLLQLSEFFGHGFGILAVGLFIAMIDPPRRWAVPRVVFMAIGAGLLADFVKMVVARLRPRDGTLATSMSDVVQGWFVVAGEGKARSFPSGHAAATVALALALSALYPRGRWFFYALAFLAMCQRLDEGAHFVSDLVAGAAIGCFTVAVSLCVGPIAALFDRREAQWR